MTSPYSPLEAALAATCAAPWAGSLMELADRALAQSPHGDLPSWRESVDALPGAPDRVELDRPEPVLGGPVDDRRRLEALLGQLHPWRKGPLRIGGVSVDAEWRSDLKWDRVAPHVDLRGHLVLDVGCGNGYFGWRMLGAGARCVIGLDPTVVYVMQWMAQARYAPGHHNFVLPLRDADLPERVAGFDSVFSMGVLYHRRRPGRHLEWLMQRLRPGGTLVLETLVLDAVDRHVLRPEGRYARMRNVWHIPSVQMLVHDLGDAGFNDIALLDVTATTPAEQRSTAWMRFESLAQCLDPRDPTRTVEGYPAPVRAVLRARRPG